MFIAAKYFDLGCRRFANKETNLPIYGSLASVQVISINFIAAD